MTDIGKLKDLRERADAARSPTSSQMFNPHEAAYYDALRNSAPSIIARLEAAERAVEASRAFCNAGGVSNALEWNHFVDALRAYDNQVE